MPSTALPEIPRHYSHIRYAALAYNGNPVGPNEEQLLRQSVDLVVPNARYLDQINKVAPKTPQLVYSNVSNLYLDLLTDWLNYADRYKVSRESAFYHVSQSTAFVGDSPSSQPVTWLWNVQRGSDAGFKALTSESRTGYSGDLRFPGLGESLYLGYPERFRELNLSIYQAGGAAWAGVLEYPSQVNCSGKPTAWRALLIGANGTNGYRQSGRVTFDPPKDWKAAMEPGSTAKLYYLRIRNTAGSADIAPIASKILGRDYVGANGNRAGTIPAFDSIADTNRDGYLTDAEFAQHRSGFEARFAYESRQFYPYYGQMRFVTNPSGRGVGGWATAYHRRLLAAHPLADGVFMDNSGGRSPVSGVGLIESVATYAADYAATLGKVNRGVSPKWVLANTSGGGIGADRVVRQVPGTVEEFALRPLSSTWSQFRDMSDTITRRLALSDPSGYLILDTLSTGGSPTDPRTRIAALAYYYTLADPKATMLMTWGGEEPASAWSRHWFDAIARDIGKPAGKWSEFATGVDPTNGSLDYKVFGRTYDKALVLYKPLSYALGKGTGNISDGTGTTHTLDGRYRPLNADGTLGPVTSTINLRNGEGAILIRA